MNPPDVVATAVDVDDFLAAGQGMPAPLLALYRLWCAKRGARTAPSRADFDVIELRPWLGFLALIDVIDGDFRYRLYGTGITAFYGHDLTGRLLSDVEPAIQAVIVPEYRRVIAEARPLYVVRRPRVRRQGAQVARIILPLASDGTTIDQILVGFHALSENG